MSMNSRSSADGVKQGGEAKVRIYTRSDSREIPRRNNWGKVMFSYQSHAIKFFIQHVENTSINSFAPKMQKKKKCVWFCRTYTANCLLT